MFKWISNKLFRQPSAVSKNRRFTEGEVKVIKIAHEVVLSQLLLCTSVTERGLIANREVVTPWVVGYMIGTLDYASRQILNEPHTDFDIVALFIETHFSPKQQKTAFAIFIAAQDAMKTGSDPFMSGAHYIEGAKAGYQQFDDEDKSSTYMPLVEALMNSGYPKNRAA